MSSFIFSRPFTRNPALSEPKLDSTGAARNAIQVSIAQRDAKANYLAAYLIAQLYAELGDKDHAFEWLNSAYQEHNLWIPTLRTDFTLDSLQSDPRYTDLVHKLAFPQ
jgi:hypothetical protein